MTEGVINFKDWSKLDLKVGEIIKIEDIEGADFLYKLTVDIGSEKRIICAGIKPYYPKEELMNKKIIVLVNLAPRKMRGIESKGMLLAAGSQDENLCVLISPEKDVPNGTKIS